MSKNKFLKNSFFLMIFTMVSRVLGLIREIVRSSYLGTSTLSDLYILAFFIPNLLRRLFAEGSISVAFVPTFKGFLHNENKEETSEFLSSILTVLVFLITLVVLLGIIFSPFLVRIFGADLSEIPEAALLTRIMFPYLAFISLAALFQGILNSSGSFSPSGFVPILFNISVIGCTMILSPSMANPARAMSVGVFFGGLLQAAFQLPFVLKYRYSFRFIGLKRAFKNPGTRRIGHLLAPTLVGMAAYQFNNIISTLLAKKCAEGVLSSVNFSLRLQELILGIFVVSLSTVLLSELSTNIKEKNWEQLNSNMDFAIKIIVLLTIPIILFFSFSNRELVSLIYKSNAFDEHSVQLTSAAFAFHLPGILFISITRILNPAFYASENTKKPALAGIISVGANVVIALFLYKPMQGRGIALATSISAFVNAFLLLIFLKENKRIDAAKIYKGLIFYSLKMLFFSGLSLVPFLLLKDHIYGLFNTGGKVIDLGVPFFLSAILYFGTGLLLLTICKDPQLFSMVKIIKERKAR